MLIIETTIVVLLYIIVVEGRNVDECYYIDSIGCMNDYDLNWQPTEVTWL